MAETEAQPTTPWQIARNRYLEQLEPHERVLFNEATVQNLFYSSSNLERADRLSSKARKGIDALRPLIEKIESYGKAMDTYANIAPTFIAPIWGSLRVILVFAQRFERFYERMTDSLGRIGDILPRLLDYQRIFSQAKHPRLKEALANTYLDIIGLCMEFRAMLRAQQKSFMKRVVQPLGASVEKQFKDAEGKFRAHKKTVEKEAETCHMIEAAEARAIVCRDRQLQEMKDKATTKKRILNLLSATSSHEKHKKLKSLRHGKSGNWIFSTSEFQRWTQFKATSVLCCYGIPGCGKTILASGVIDFMLSLSASETRSPKLAFHYCDHADKRTLEPVKIVGSCLRSMFETADIPPQIIELITKAYKDGERSPEFKEMLDILLQSIGVFDEVILAIDGIDETKEKDRQILFEILNSLMKHHSYFKLFISCREDVALSFSPAKSSYFCLQVSATVISTDISGYIRDSVESLLEKRKIVLRKAELKEEIITALTDGAKGMFLWVKFQLDDLCNAESDAEIKSTLQNLPQDLSETYDRLLDRIIGANRQSLIKRMFQWIICARRPLTIGELCEGIAFTIDDNFWNEAKIPTDLSRLIRASGNLVVVDNESRTIQLAHYTVQQHIIDDRKSTRKFFRFNIQEANEVLGEVCVAYLNFADFETQVTPYVDNRVTANMATLEKLLPEFSRVDYISQTKGPLVGIARMGRMFQSKASPANIDYNRYIPVKSNPLETFLEKYVLLEYIRENWLWHTTTFVPSEVQGDKRDILFHQLVLRKQLPFSFRPWKIEADIKINYRYLEPVGWALATNHSALLHTLLKTNNDFRPWRYIKDAARWFFDKSPSSHISSAMIQRLERCSEDTWDVNSVPRQGWLYGKFIDACRRGNLDVLKVCFNEESDLPLGEGYPWNQLISHLIIEAAANGQLSVVDFILKHPTIGDMYDVSFTMAHNKDSLNALEIAALAGSIHVVTRLRVCGWQPSNMSSSSVATGFEYLNQAVDGGNMNVFEALLFTLKPSDFGVFFEMPEEVKSKGLMLAASAGYLSLVKSYCKYGVDPLKPDIENHCAYMRAIKNGRLEVVEYLISTGCGVGANIEGLPLSMAALTGNVKMAELLIFHGAEVFNNSGKMQSLIYVTPGHHSESWVVEVSPIPLYIAAVNGHSEIVKLLLKNGAGSDAQSATGLCSAILNATNPEFNRIDARRLLFLQDEETDEVKNIVSKLNVPYVQTPLAGAALTGHENIVELLLKTTVTVDIEDSNNDTALFLAAVMGYTTIVDLLLGAEAKPNWNRLCSDTAALRLLLNRGLSPKIVDANRETSLFAAAKHGSVQALELLLEHRFIMDVLINYPGPNNQTPLLKAADQGHAAAASILIAAGANLDAIDANGYSPLMLAARRGCVETTDLLLSKGALVDFPGTVGLSPLAVACTKSHSNIVRQLLSHGANANCWLPRPYFSVPGDPNLTSAGDNITEVQFTALMAASMNGSQQVVELLIAANADVNAKDEIGCTALMLAVINDSQTIVALLIAAGADLDAKDNSGYTALTFAIINDSWELVALLIAAGADPNAKDNSGYTALTFAIINDSQDLAELLIDAADSNAKDNHSSTLMVSANNSSDSMVEESFSV